MDAEKSEKKLCLVLGGSFNPPTKAHVKLLQEAMALEEKASGRETCGVLVPSSHAYVSRKMSKNRSPGAPWNHVFPEAMRLDMLLELIEGTGLAVSNCEFGDDGRGRTYEMLERLRDEDPSMDYTLVAGADKLRILPRWHDIGRLLEEFGLTVMARGGTWKDAKARIARDPLLSKYQHRIRVIGGMPEDAAAASSTDARSMWANDDYDGLAALCGFRATAMMARYKARGCVHDGREAFRDWIDCGT